MATQADIVRYRENLKEERNAITLYEHLARVEPNSSLGILYRKLAETERKHAAVWEQRLQEAGTAVPAWRVDWRTRVLSWLAGRFGVGFVLPTIAGIEQGAGARYDTQPEVNGTGMPGDERSHARIFKMLSGQTNGLAGSGVARLEGRHRSAGGNALRAGVLGANDGLVSILSLVMGVAGAVMDSHMILIAGLSGLLAGAISMALGEWLSVQSSRELYTRQLDIERQELIDSPEEEREELVLIYQAKGVAPEQARQVADHLLSDPVYALDTLSREELGVDPDELGGSAWVAAFTSFLLFAAGALIPIFPFFFTHGMKAVIWSGGLSAVGLFVIGAGITLVTGRSVWRSGFRQIAFGLTAAAVTYGIGRLLGVQIAGS
ncbi:MAG: VIT1/CCC1 transporter family protein [bacterium]